MINQSILNEFFLSGFSDLPALQLPLFLFFLLIYLLTLIWNVLTIILIVTDPHLHVPMYFFLGNLASLDLCYTSLTVPRILFDLHTKIRKISVKACKTQLFFFMFFAGCEVFLLTIMSYDRYIAICKPLHYTQIMSWKVCLQLVSIAWFLCFTHSLVHTLYVFKLTFCGSDIIESFFCDLPLLFRISCSDIYINILLILILGGFVAVGSLILIILSYVYIFKAVLKIQAKGNRSKVFSTCNSHLTLLFMYYGSTMFNYFWQSAGHRFSGYKVLSIFYAVFLPLLNPLTYSLRNQDFRKAFHIVSKKIFLQKQR